MDEEMSFPNPVVRTDLPVKKARWPRVLAGVGIFVLLITVFLPQILNSVLGRAIIKQYLGSKFNADVALIDFHTSWFGGTSAVEIWIKNQDGHIIGCHEIKTEASLLKLLRGHYELGNCTVTNPLVDWVVDYADAPHSDSYNRLMSRAPNLAGVPPPAAPRVSGSVTVRGGMINLLRANVASGTLQTTYQSMRFTSVDGTFTAKTAVDPWQCDVTARAGDDKTQPGTVTVKGTIGFGGTRVFTPAGLQMSLKVDGQTIPAPACVPVYLPVMTAEDVRQAIGPMIDTLKFELSADAGKLTFATLDVVGSRGQVHLRPVIDLKASPMVMTLAAPATVTIGIPGGEVRRELSAIQPFLSAAGGEGVAILRLDSFTVPLDQRGWRSLFAAGEIELHEVKLSTPPPAPQGGASGLVVQLSLLTGATNPSPLLNAGPARFKIDGGQVSITPAQSTVDDTLLSVTGSTAPDGTLTMSLALAAAPRLTAAVPELAASSGPVLLVPLTGTTSDPKLDFAAARGGLSAAALPNFDAYLAAQTAQLKARQAEAAKRPQERAVETMIQDFRPTTKPSP